MKKFYNNLSNFNSNNYQSKLRKNIVNNNQNKNLNQNKNKEEISNKQLI
jgi:hypothetical protein